MRWRGKRTQFSSSSEKTYDIYSRRKRGIQKQQILATVSSAGGEGTLEAKKGETLFGRSRPGAERKDREPKWASVCGGITVGKILEKGDGSLRK